MPTRQYTQTGSVPFTRTLAVWLLLKNPLSNPPSTAVHGSSNVDCVAVYHTRRKLRTVYLVRVAVLTWLEWKTKVIVSPGSVNTCGGSNSSELFTPTLTIISAAARGARRARDARTEANIVNEVVRKRKKKWGSL